MSNTCWSNITLKSHSYSMQHNAVPMRTNCATNRPTLHHSQVCSWLWDTPSGNPNLQVSHTLDDESFSQPVTRQKKPPLSQPHFGLSVRMRLTLSKVAKWSPPRLPKTQSSIADFKSPRIWMFLVSLKFFWSVDVQNGLAWAIWNIHPTLWAKEVPGVKFAVWLPTTKSLESTSSQCL
jgi:hypothetical protein